MTNIISQNDKVTMKDEIKLLLIILGCIAVGVLLIACKLEFWCITKVHTIVFGALLILTGAMLIPGFLYCLSQLLNDK